jgi:hypothetical protein
LRDADRRFATVLASNPRDGPARFYHSYCERDPTGAPTPVGGVTQLEHRLHFKVAGGLHKQLMVDLAQHGNCVCIAIQSFL